MKKILRSTGLLACVVFSCSAVETRFWQHDDISDFEKGRLDHVSLRSDGRLFLAPEFREVFDSSTPYLWTIASDSKGNLYTAGGGSGSGAAKLFEIDPSGKSRALAELEGLEIHALAVDRRDNIYAATDPDGKIYKVARGGKPVVFFDPKVKYIWALAFDSKDNLFVATGDQGEIYRITPDGKGAVFFKTEETHARSLTIDAHDNLIAGTEPGGLVIRISPAGEGFVLYQAPKREITAVAVAKDGAIYASGIGNKTGGAPVVIAPAAVPTPSPVTAAPGAITLSPAAPHAAPPGAVSGTPPPAIVGGSEVYRISPDGAPRKLWTSPQDLVYSIAFDSAGLPLVGTGNRGKIYRLDSDVLSTSLIDASPTQVTGFASTSQGKLYAITGNIGRVYEIGPGSATSGTYESEVQDAGSFSYWGRLGFRGAVSTIKVSTRSGNLNRPQVNWSPWMTLVRDASDPVLCLRCGGGRIASPSARFLQYKVELNAAGSKAPPELASVEIAYLPKNTAPVVEDIDIAPPNYKFPAPAAPAAPSTSITLPPLGQRKSASSAPSLDLGTSQTLTYTKGWIGVRWAAGDDDGDSLTYKIEIRGENESEWRLLKDKIREKYYSWDSTAFPDGEYVVRVTASDSPSNPPDQALASSLIGDPFLIDNTPPEILNLAAAPSGNRIEIHWKARDARSNIDKAEYSVNGGEWQIVQPLTRLSDSPIEEYRLLLDRASPGEQVIAVRVADEFDNQAADKVVVK
jgi:sugar lactone lactonase YvrE